MKLIGKSTLPSKGREQIKDGRRRIKAMNDAILQTAVVAKKENSSPLGNRLTSEVQHRMISYHIFRQLLITSSQIRKPTDQKEGSERSRSYCSDSQT